MLKIQTSWITLTSHRRSLPRKKKVQKMVANLIYTLRQAPSRHLMQHSKPSQERIIALNGALPQAMRNSTVTCMIFTFLAQFFPINCHKLRIYFVSLKKALKELSTKMDTSKTLVPSKLCEPPGFVDSIDSQDQDYMFDPIPLIRVLNLLARLTTLLKSIWSFGFFIYEEQILK